MNLVEQMIRRSKTIKIEEKPEYNCFVSTGSTLLDLSISGGISKHGGIPLGIMVEIFGPSSSGKTVLLCELAGSIQRMGGSVVFADPEARLNKTYSKLFGMKFESVDYFSPDTVTSTFKYIQKLEPKTEITGVFVDSLAALSTNLEMDDEDKMGMRRAKEFSQELRKTCRVIKQKNILLVCSNQVRVNATTLNTLWGEKFISPGGQSVGFYSSIRLRAKSSEKIKKAKKVNGIEHKRVIGIQSNFEIYKSSIGKPSLIAPVSIIYDYGIDDIRANLQFLNANGFGYGINGQIFKKLESAIAYIEENDLVSDLKNETIRVWREIESNFTEKRKPKWG